MKPFDLVFIVAFLTTVLAVVGVLVAFARGRPDTAVRRLRRLVIGVVVYMTAVTAVSLFSTRQVIAIGTDQCSDDWCIAVADVSTRESGDELLYDVAFRLSSRARGRPQRERFVVAYLIDAEGSRFDAEPESTETPFDVLLDPGQAVVAARSFRVPKGSSGLGVVIAREGDLAFPRCCIIGEGPFMKWPVVKVKGPGRP